MLLLELRILSMENARGFEVRGEGWGPRGREGSRGSGMLRKGRNRKGLVMGREGGGEAMVEPEEEWKEVESGERGELTEDSGESHTLIRGEPAPARSGDTASCSILTVVGTRLCCLDTNMAPCLLGRCVRLHSAHSTGRCHPAQLHTAVSQSTAPPPASLPLVEAATNERRPLAGY